MEKHSLFSQFVSQIIHTQLVDGRSVCIRAIRSTDEQRMRDGIAQLSERSKYLRFFTSQSTPPDAVVKMLVDVDNHDHLAWGAIFSDDPAHPAIGAVHVIRIDGNNNSGEFSVAVVDSFQGVGLARMLTAVVLTNCCLQKITTLEVQILSENSAAKSLVRSLGGQHCKTEFNIQAFEINTQTAIQTLKEQADYDGLKDVLSALKKFA